MNAEGVSRNVNKMMKIATVLFSVFYLLLRRVSQPAGNLVLHKAVDQRCSSKDGCINRIHNGPEWDAIIYLRLSQTQFRSLLIFLMIYFFFAMCFTLRCTESELNGHNLSPADPTQVQFIQ